MANRLQDLFDRARESAVARVSADVVSSLPDAGGRVLVPVLVALLAVPFLVSPAQEPEVPEQPTVNQQVAVAPDRQRVAAPPTFSPEEFSPPGDGGTSPAPAAEPVAQARPVVPDEVEPIGPDLIVRPKKVDPQGLFSALEVKGVRHLAGASELKVEVEAPTGKAPMTLLVVDPLAFRPLTPDATAKARQVWERLVAGEMVVRHDVAQKFQLPLGGTVPVKSTNGSQLGVRIGAFASNGSPPLADALIPWSIGGQLGAGSPNLLVIAVNEEERASSIGEQVVDLLGGGEMRELEPPTEQRARLVGAGSTSFEPFSYIDHGDGMITIDPSWVRRNIVTVTLPVFGGTARCHKVMARQLVAALQEVEARGLGHLIDRNDYGGCWVPRHILFNPRKPLSMHAWGLAVDFNVQTNQYGARPQMDMRIVEIFRKWGFKWGGDWSTPDGMHFELGAVIQ